MLLRDLGEPVYDSRRVQRADQIHPPSRREWRPSTVSPLGGSDGLVFDPYDGRLLVGDTLGELANADVDDRRARVDWGHAPKHGLREAVRDYLVPVLARRYGIKTVSG